MQVYVTFGPRHPGLLVGIFLAMCLLDFICENHKTSTPNIAISQTEFELGKQEVIAKCKTLPHDTVVNARRIWAVGGGAYTFAYSGECGRNGLLSTGIN
jgi:hypothetical protein